jgi:hypothetical protein
LPLLCECVCVCVCVCVLPSATCPSLFVPFVCYSTATCPSPLFPFVFLYYSTATFPSPLVPFLSCSTATCPLRAAPKWTPLLYTNDAMPYSTTLDITFPPLPFVTQPLVPCGLPPSGQPFSVPTMLCPTLQHLTSPSPPCPLSHSHLSLAGCPQVTTLLCTNDAMPCSTTLDITFSPLPFVTQPLVPCGLPPSGRRLSVPPPLRPHSATS